MTTITEAADRAADLLKIGQRENLPEPFTLTANAYDISIGCHQLSDLNLWAQVLAVTPQPKDRADGRESWEAAGYLDGIPVRAWWLA